MRTQENIKFNSLRILGAQLQSDSFLWNHSRPCPSVRPSVLPSQNFLAIGSLVFFWYCTYDDRWPWYLVTDKARFFLKKIGGPNLGPISLNQAQNEVFPHFLEFGLNIFLEIVYNDSLRQCLISSRGKNHEKMSGAKIWAKWAKIRPQVRFFTIFSSLVY